MSAAGSGSLPTTSRLPRPCRTRAGVARVRCFQAQQAAEKAIKGVLVHLQIDFENIHDLMNLANLLPPDWALSSKPGALPELSIWAVKGRYPGDWPDATEEDAVRAVEIARLVVNQVLGHFARRGVLPRS